ncbi:MAG: DUF2007 domain-containing protein [Bacteroidales bacterium]
MDKDWQVVFTGGELYIAEMAKQMLKDNRIESVIVNKKDSAYPMIGYVEVLVAPANKPKAEKLIKEFES